METTITSNGQSSGETTKFITKNDAKGLLAEPSETQPELQPQHDENNIRSPIDQAPSGMGLTLDQMRRRLVEATAELSQLKSRNMTMPVDETTALSMFNKLRVTIAWFRKEVGMDVPENELSYGFMIDDIIGVVRQIQDWIEDIMKDIESKGGESCLKTERIIQLEGVLRKLDLQARVGLSRMSKPPPAGYEAVECSSELNERTKNLQEKCKESYLTLQGVRSPAEIGVLEHIEQCTKTIQSLKDELHQNFQFQNKTTAEGREAILYTLQNEISRLKLK